MTTENNGTYTFDFEAEVHEAFCAYPELTADTFFIDADTSDKKKARVYGSAYKIPPLIKETFAKGLPKKAETVTKGIGAMGTFINLKYIMLDTKVSENPFFKPKDLDRFLFFALSHEMGHRLVPNAYGAIENRHFHECAADAFATIRYLQKFGVDDDIKNLMQHRAYAGLTNKHTDVIPFGAYLTSRVVENILETDLPYDVLTPKQTIDLAEAFAKKFMFDSLEIQNMKCIHTPFLNAQDNPDKSFAAELYQLASTTLDAPNKHSFMIGAYAFNAFVHPDGCEYKGTHIEGKEKLRLRFHDKMIDKAKEMSCDRLQRELLETKGDILVRANFPEYKHVPKKQSKDTNYNFDPNF